MAFIHLHILTVGLLLTLCSATVKLDGQGQSFSSAIKQFEYNTLGNEVTLFEKKSSEPGYITEQWFTSAMDGPFDQYAKIRIYVDGENEASLDFNVSLSGAIDAAATGIAKPWATRMFGRLANGGGFFNTFRIPFLFHIRITLTNTHSTGALWYIVRGLVGVKLAVGSFELPNRTRLRVYKQDQVVAPFDFVTLSKTTNKSGMLFLVTFDIQSDTATFMEGCVRAKIDNSDETTFLSSGMEDFFLSAFYFNGGSYEGFQSGLTYKVEDDSGNGHTQVVAYKFFLDDPILFRQSFQLIWRNNEVLGGETGCPDRFPAYLEGEGLHTAHFPGKKRKGPFSAAPPPKDAYIQTYVWVYEW